MNAPANEPPNHAPADGTNELLVALPGAPDVLTVTETTRLGRAETNGLVVNHDLVSTEHLELRRSDDGWEIVDLGSTNGTFVHDTRVLRAPVEATTTVRLGPGEPAVHLTIPGLTPKGGSRKIRTSDIVDRYLANEAPVQMSPHTRLIRAALPDRQTQDTNIWVKRTRHSRLAILALLVLSMGASGTTVWQARRVQALHVAAGAVFNTMKSLVNAGAPAPQFHGAPHGPCQQQRTLCARAPFGRNALRFALSAATFR